MGDGGGINWLRKVARVVDMDDNIALLNSHYNHRMFRSLGLPMGKWPGLYCDDHWESKVKVFS